MSSTLEFFENVLYLLIGFFSTMWNAIFMPIPDFLSTFDNPFIDFLLGIIEFVGIEAFLSSFTLGSFIFGGVVIAILIVYFFIP